ncbi:aspartate 1-decarboxylase [Acidobacteriota bacterium]
MRCFLHGKIHRLRVSETRLDYEGSLTLDTELMDAAGFYPFEKVDIYDISNGARFSTYLIEGAAGSGQVCLNGAAARLAEPGDLIIVAGYTFMDEADGKKHRPTIVHVDQDNRIVRKEECE